jgi:hypothetical protein
MLSFKAFWAMFASGTRGYPILAYSHCKNRYQKYKGITPGVVVTVTTDRGCRRVTLSQAEFAEKYSL